MKLQFLEFDASPDAEGGGSFDAMASAVAAQLPALQAEVARVLAWAHGEFPGRRGPLEDDGEWDYELQGVQEVATTLDVSYDAAAGDVHMQPGPTGAPRVTLSLTLSGTPQFCESFRAEFELF